jgi:SAM-dependent methyltransferase
MLIGNNMSEKEYWDKFYKKHSKSNFEWLIDDTCTDEIISCLNSFKPSNQSQNATTTANKLTFLLDAGCGSSVFSSRLASSMSNANYLLCGDFSRQALELLKANNENNNNDNNNNNNNNNNKSNTLISKTNEHQIKTNKNYIDFVQCDCKYLPFRDNLFDLILDKGYLDSLLKKIFISSNQIAVSDALLAMSNLLEKLDYMHDKNKKNQENNKGKKYLIQITDEVPELRISLFDQFDQSKIKIDYFYKEINFGHDLVYYAYFINKF